ncbi:MAG: DUF2975 domain-containing protein [Saprospiraceae bacterium]
MQTKISQQVPKVLRYVFLVLTIAGSLFLALNTAANFGIASDGPFLRGFVATYNEPGPTVSHLPDGQGELKVMNHSEKKFVLLGFSGLSAMLKVRHLFYLLNDSMSWVLAIMALYQMYRIFYNLEQKAVFCDDNVRRIRVIALCVLIYPFISLESTLQFKAIVSRIPDHGLNLAPVPVLHESLAVGVLLSLIVFALAEVFRTGTHLQQEQDLTI